MNKATLRLPAFVALLAAVLAAVAGSALAAGAIGVNPPAVSLPVSVPSASVPTTSATSGAVSSSAGSTVTTAAAKSGGAPRSACAAKAHKKSKKAKRACGNNAVRTLMGVVLADTQASHDEDMSEPTCVAAEEFVGTGHFVHRFQIVSDGTGGMHLQDHYTASGSGSGQVADELSPTGFTQVSSYQFSDDQIASTNLPGFPLAQPFETNVVFYTKVIRKAETVANDDLFLREQAQVTIDANGQITAAFDRPSSECR